MTSGGGRSDGRWLLPVREGLRLEAGDVPGGVGGKPWVACTSTLGAGMRGASLLLTSVSNLTLAGIYVSGLELQGGSNITLKDVHITCQNDGAHFELWGGYCNAKIEEMLPT